MFKSNSLINYCNEDQLEDLNFLRFNLKEMYSLSVNYKLEYNLLATILSQPFTRKEKYISNNITTLILNKELDNIKYLDVNFVDGFEINGKILLNNLIKNLKYLSVTFEQFNKINLAIKTIKLHNLNNTLISLKLNSNFVHKFVFSCHIPNSLKYIQFNRSYISKQLLFPNKLEIILIKSRFDNKKLKQKFPFSTKILLCSFKLKNNFCKIKNISKVVFVA